MLLNRRVAWLALAACATTPPPTPTPSDPLGYGVVKTMVASRHGALTACLRPRARALGPMKVPLEFTVVEGKVVTLWVDEPTLKDDEVLRDCFLTELRGWPFSESFSGDIGFSFRIGEAR